MICQWDCLKKKTHRVKDFFVRSLAKRLQSQCLDHAKQLLHAITVVALSEKSAIFKKKKKKQIMKKIQEHKIKIYEFPDVDEDDDNKLVRKIKEKMPLAVVGSNVVIEVNSKKVRGCQYPWGVAEVENVEQFDFTVLRNMLIRTHMQDLKDVTNNINYKNYRKPRGLRGLCQPPKPSTPKI
uniref:Septin-type G domain-containing protein n=1 Tax=Neolamprologus brichardi TaxID=32507 RepID=A0A3Q4M8E9_NEOBR